MTTSTRPKLGTRAAEVHQRVHALRQAAANEPPGVSLSMIRRMSEEQAKSALAVAIASESWPLQDRRAMAYPPEPDYRAIADENAALRDEFAEMERRATQAQDHQVVFAEEAA